MTPSRTNRRWVGALSAVVGLALASAAGAQAMGEAATGVASTSGVTARARSIDLPAGKSASVELPVDSRDVIVTNPAVADVVLRTPRNISVLGLKQGTTDAVFFDAAGRRILSLDVHVGVDATSVSETINRLMPGAHVHAEGVNGTIVLTGQVASASDADQAVQIARTAVAKPELVLNMLSIAGKDQVMLKVRIVEVQRNIIKQLGFNLSAVAKIGGSNFSFAQLSTFAINGALLGGGIGAYNYTNNTPANGLKSAEAAIAAFERVGLVRTLAEPNLTAISGESAKFLAGGEFPVPTGVALNGEVSVDFKSFGVGLGFTPVVLSSGRISLKISTEVSQLSNTGAFTTSSGSSTGTTTGGTSGVTLVIPALTVRRAETTVELPSGGAMMIAGLLQDDTAQDIDALPGLKSLPVLGALFRSRDYQAGQTELVVIVTPYLVTAANPDDLQTPADGLQVASDKDTILLGKLNKSFNHPPQAAAGHSYQAPIGYVVE